jgi:hypothetical protein
MDKLTALILGEEEGFLSSREASRDGTGQAELL